MTCLHRHPNRRNGRDGYNYGDIKGGEHSFHCAMDDDFLNFYKKTAREYRITPVSAGQVATQQEIRAGMESAKKGIRSGAEGKKTTKSPNNTAMVEVYVKESVRKRA